MELPDPISKVTWDNYVTMCPEDVKAQGFKEMLRQDIDATVVNVTVNGVTKITCLSSTGSSKRNNWYCIGLRS